MKISCKILFITLFIIVNIPLFNTDKLISQKQNNILFQAEKFRFILELINTHYKDSTDIDVLSTTVFKTMLKSLDPQSEYYTAEQMKKFREFFDGRQVGVGLVALPYYNNYTVVYTEPGSPADLAGFKPGDKIFNIDDISVSGLDLAEFNKLLAGEENTEIKIKYNPLGSKAIYYPKLIRSKFIQKSIQSSFIIGNSDIAYIAINRFTSNTPEEFKDAVQNLISDGMQNLILDLRDNPGGYLEEVVQIADMFLPEGKLLTYTNARHPNHYSEHYSTEQNLLLDIPLIVLVNDKSASGSEIIAGIMQDYDRGYVVGDRTYGKGSVQKSWNLADSTGIKITVAEYCTPSGRPIQKQFVDSASLVLDPSLELSLDNETLSQIRQSIMQTGGKSEMDIYFSEKGRPIIGGGGVTPDFFVSNDTTSLLFRLLKQRLIFEEWAINIYNIQYELLLAENPNYRIYEENFKITDELIHDFAKIAIEKKIWNREMFEIDKRLIIDEMRAILARIIYGIEAYQYVKVPHDKQLVRAIQLIPNAKKLLE